MCFWGVPEKKMITVMRGKHILSNSPLENKDRMAVLKASVLLQSIMNMRVIAMQH